MYYYYATICKRCYDVLNACDFYSDIHFSSTSEGVVSKWVNEQTALGHELIHRAGCKHKEDLPGHR
jgi:hypothetical protein